MGLGRLENRPAAAPCGSNGAFLERRGKRSTGTRATVGGQGGQGGLASVACLALAVGSLGM